MRSYISPFDCLFLSFFISFSFSFPKIIQSSVPVPGPITAAGPVATGPGPINPNEPPNPMNAPPQGPHFQCGPAILTYNSGYPMLPTQTPCGK